MSHMVASSVPSDKISSPQNINGFYNVVISALTQKTSAIQKYKLSGG